MLDKGSIKCTGEVSDVINTYIAANLAEVGDVSHLTAFRRVGTTTRELEILELTRVSHYHVDSNEDIVFAAKVKRNSKSIKTFKFTTLVDNIASGGTRVGMAYSPELVWPDDADIAEFQISLPEHHLAKGKYILDVWIGQGDITSSYKYFDAVYDTLTLKVDTINGTPISEWHNYWGEAIWELKLDAVSL